MKKGRKNNSSLRLPFRADPRRVDSAMLPRGGPLPCKATDSNAPPVQNPPPPPRKHTHTQTHPETTSDQTPGGPHNATSKMNHHSIIIPLVRLPMLTEGGDAMRTAPALRARAHTPALRARARTPHPGSPRSHLHSPGLMTLNSWTSVSSSVKWGGWRTPPGGMRWGSHDKTNVEAIFKLRLKAFSK